MVLIAHRAGTDRYPEQCLKAVNNSHSAGADYVEVDIRFTKDKETPVVCHDQSVKRVFGVDANVEDLTMSEFLNLRQIQDITIGTYSLETLFKSTEAKLLLHIKVGKEYLAPILETIHLAKAESRVVLGIEHPEDVKVIKNNDPKIKILAFMPDVDALDAFLETECDYIRLWETWVSQERISKIKSARKGVWIMSGTPKTVGYTQWNNLLLWKDMGVDGVLINEIEKAIKLMENANGFK